MTRKLNPIIDADGLVYRVGFAVKDHEPVTHSLHNIKVTIQDILNQFPEHEWFKLYLSGPNNFRDHLASIRPYKGNRKEAKRPRDYKEIREYLIDVWKAEVVDWKEADDACVTEQYAHKDKSTVLVSNDKDLRTCPGWHYNWVKRKVDYVDSNQAVTNFWRQMLEGDTSDNIPGVNGVGPKTADKIIDGCKGDVLLLRDMVRDLYRKQYGPDGWELAYEEVGNLLWIQRQHGQKCPLL